MPIQGLTITLTTSPTLIAGSQSSAAFGAHGNLNVLIRNRGAASVYLGDAAVTTNGFPVTTADVIDPIRLLSGESLYGTSTAAIGISVLRFGETT
jgi:hypothetical protein